MILISYFNIFYSIHFFYSQNQSGKCKVIHYCSSSCQLSHWQFHKGWCKVALKKSEESLSSCSDVKNREVIAPHSQTSALAYLEKTYRSGRVGLDNLGNSCYMSSCLQCVAHITPLASYLLSNKFESHINKDNFDGTNGVLVRELSSLLKSLWFENKSSIAPFQFKKSLGRLNPDFAGSIQHDAHEFMGYLLDKVHEDVNLIVGKKPYYESPEGNGKNDAEIANDHWEKDNTRSKSLVKNLTGSLLRNKMCCKVCGNMSVKFDIISHQQVEIPIKDIATKRIISVYLFPPYFPSKVPSPISERSFFRPTKYMIQMDPYRSVGDLNKEFIKIASADDENSKQIKNDFIFSMDKQTDQLDILHNDSLLLSGSEKNNYYIYSSLFDSQNLFKAKNKVVIFVYQRIVEPSKSLKKPFDIVFANNSLPIILPIDASWSLSRIRTTIWQHVAARMVLPNSALGQYIRKYDEDKASIKLLFDCAQNLPIRLIDENKRGKKASSLYNNNNNNNGSNSGSFVTSLMEGFASDGGLGESADYLGSMLPCDNTSTICTFTASVENAYLSIDWSGLWSECLDQKEFGEVNKHVCCIEMEKKEREKGRYKKYIYLLLNYFLFLIPFILILYCLPQHHYYQLLHLVLFLSRNVYATTLVRKL